MSASTSTLAYDGGEPIRPKTKTLIKTESKSLLPIRDSQHKRYSKPSSILPYIGVRQRRWGRYVSEIRIPKMKTRIWLGSFDSPEMAARAYDSAALYLKGESAILNFPKLAGSLPAPISSCRRDIQIAAAKAALESVPNLDELDSSRTKSVSEVEDAWWFSDDEMASFFNEVQDCPLRGSFSLEPVVAREDNF